MKHYYSTINENVLTFSDIRKDGPCDYLSVYFERPNETGFDFAEGTVPACTFTKSYGFSQEELLDMQDYLRDNQLLMWQLASGYFDEDHAEGELAHA